jgi:hypothetical protein
MIYCETCYLIATGVLIFTGFDKTIESKILDTGYNGSSELEASLINFTEFQE